VMRSIPDASDDGASDDFTLSTSFLAAKISTQSRRP